MEKKSLEKTLLKFESTENADELGEKMFVYWRKSPIFEDAAKFLSNCEMPYIIVSNIDSDDIAAAIKYHNLNPTKVFTSEDARSYKPRKELFELALRESGLKPEEVIHIGDSLSSDIKGASELGIKTIWINRGGKEVPEGVVAVSSFTEIFETEYFK